MLFFLPYVASCLQGLGNVLSLPVLSVRSRNFFFILFLTGRFLISISIQCPKVFTWPFFIYYLFFFLFFYMGGHSSHWKSARTTSGWKHWYLCRYVDGKYETVPSFVKKMSDQKSDLLKILYLFIRLKTESWNNWRINCHSASAGHCTCQWPSWLPLNSPNTSLVLGKDSSVHKGLHLHMLRIFYSLTKLVSLVFSLQVTFISLSGQGRDVFWPNSPEEPDRKPEHMFFLPWPAQSINKGKGRKSEDACS